MITSVLGRACTFRTVSHHWPFSSIRNILSLTNSTADIVHRHEKCIPAEERTSFCWISATRVPSDMLSEIRGATGSDEPWSAEQPPLAVFPDCTRRYWVDMWSAHRIPQLHFQLSKPDRYFFIQVTTPITRLSGPRSRPNSLRKILRSARESNPGPLCL
jgi:hypothetical protein